MPAVVHVQQQNKVLTSDVKKPSTSATVTDFHGEGTHVCFSVSKLFTQSNDFLHGEGLGTSQCDGLASSHISPASSMLCVVWPETQRPVHHKACVGTKCILMIAVGLTVLMGSKGY